MSYRGPQALRIQQQRTDSYTFAGHTAIWRQYISASAGLDYGGDGPTPYYRQQLITAQFASVVGMGLRIGEGQLPAGMLASAEFIVTSREKFGSQDEITWQGKTYRIESESVLSRLNGTYVNVLKRGEP